MADFIQTFITGPIWSSIEYLTGWVFTDSVKRTLEWISLLGGATAAFWGRATRLFGRKSGLEASIDAVREEMRKHRAMMEEHAALRMPALNRYADGNAGIETIERAGYKKALSDASGVAGEIVLDALISQRASERAQTNRDDAALYRQKGAFAALHDHAVALAAYEQAVMLDPDHENGWSGLFLAANVVADEYVLRGAYDQAEAAFLRMNEAAKRLGNPDLEAYAIGSLGRVEFNRGHLQKAESLFQRMEQIVVERGTKELEVGAVAYLETIYQTQDKAELAQIKRKRKDELLLELESRQE